jgi:pimeloyl-ACP methyl ester carboxylesterase
MYIRASGGGGTAMQSRIFKGRRRVIGALAVVVAAGLIAGALWLGRDGRGDASMTEETAFFRTPGAEAPYMAAYDAVLAGWPVAYEDIYVPTSMGVTHVIASGADDAPPLVLLHAAMATATVWRPNIEELSRHFRVYAVDVVGQGGKSVASRTVKNRRDYADWMNELFDGLGIERASIVGNSYGGFLALNQASLAPERVDRVVLISPPGGFVSFMPVFRTMIWGALRAQAQRLFGVRRSAPDFMSIVGGPVGFNPDDEDWLALGRQLMDGAMVAGTLRINMIMPVVFSDAELGAIRAPTLLLIAEHEIIYEPHATLRRALERMPGLEAEIVPGAHHFAAMSRPDMMNARIVAFLEADQ